MFSSSPLCSVSWRRAICIPFSFKTFYNSVFLLRKPQMLSCKIFRYLAAGLGLCLTPFSLQERFNFLLDGRCLLSPVANLSLAAAWRMHCRARTLLNEATSELACSLFMILLAMALRAGVSVVCLPTPKRGQTA